MKPAEVTEALKLNQLKDKVWFVVPSCATTGEGLLEGLVSYFLRHGFQFEHLRTKLFFELTFKHL